jgi:hypothetical protein
MTPTNFPHQKQAIRKPGVAMKAMLKCLLGTDEFEKLYLGMKVNGVEDNVLQIFASTTESATEIRLHSEEFAVAAEYDFLLPIRMVNVLQGDDV